MGFFSNIFGKADETPENNLSIPWVSLLQATQLDEIDQKSKNNPVVIFKHSTRCGISRSVLRRFEGDFNEENPAMEFYFLDILANRDLSDAIAARYKVVHESPQMLVIQSGKVVYNVSHHDIQYAGLKQIS